MALDISKSGTITTVNHAQILSAANTNRQYWLFKNLTVHTRMWLGTAANMTGGPGSILVEPGAPPIDSRDVPEITQMAIYVLGEATGAEFTFWEVA